MGNTRNTGYLQNIVQYDASNNIILPSLSGTGTRMVVSSSTGLLSTQDIITYVSQVKHLVKSAQSITKGQAVYVSSADGTNMIVSKASNATEMTSSKTMGLLDASVSINGMANVVTEGLLAGLNTASANAGDPVWLGTDGNLIYGLLNKPSAPAHLVFIGIVTRSNTNNGEIFVKVQNGFEMAELHDYVESGVQNNFVISYESSTSLYKPKSIATLLGYTPQAALSGTGFVKISGSTISYDNSTYATQTYVNTAISDLVASAPTTLNTLNELALALGNDANFATSIATSIGTKQAQLNGTGFVKVSGTTVSYDNSTYLTTSSASSTYLPLSGGTLTGALSFSSGFGTSTSAISIYNNTASNALNVAQIDFRVNNTFSGNERVASIIALNPNAGANNGGALIFSVSANGTATIPSEDMRITHNGNIGIGTTLPQGGAGATDRTLSINSGAGAATFITGLVGDVKYSTLFTSNSQVVLESNTAIPILFKPNGNTALTLASGGAATFASWLSVGGGSEGLRLGNVGDNSSYDNVKLYYTGFNSASPRVYLTPRTTPGSGIVNTFFHLQNSNGTSTTSNNTMGLVVDGAIGIGIVPSALLQVRGPNAVGVFFDAQNDGASGATFSRINASNFPFNQYIFANGYVGINVNTPNRSLTVASDTSFYNGAASTGAIDPGSQEVLTLGFNVVGQSSIDISNIDVTLNKWKAIVRGGFANNNEGGGLVSSGLEVEVDSNNPSIPVGGSSITFSRNSSTGKLRVFCNLPSNLRITFVGTIQIINYPQSAIPSISKIILGNVGIGSWSTNLPQDRLHVNGAVQVGFVDSLNQALRIFWNGASSYGAIQTSSSSNLVLNPLGNNVGIGMTSAPTRLSIVGGSTFQFGIDGNSGNNQIYLRGGSTGDKAQIVLNHYGFADYAIAVGHTANGILSITKSVGGTDGIILNSSGNVGLGTSSISNRLQVSGNIFSTDTVFARNVKPEAWVSVTAGSPSGATIPLGYSSINIASPCDNNWRSILTNLNDTKAYFWVTLGDAASKDTANYWMSMTSPAYGVSSFGNVSYQDNGWNTGGFEFTYDNLGNGTHRLLVRCTSYYNSANTAYGTIYFLRLE
jgi:hypothetical protein